MPGEAVGSAFCKISLDDSALDSGLNSAKGKFSSALSSMEGAATKTGKAIGTALITATAAAGVALAGVATLGTKYYMDIEKSAADAASKMDLSAIAQKSGKSMEESFTGVKDHVIALSRELGQLNTNAFDPTQIAAACANLAAGGFDVATASAKDLSPMLALATATSYDLGSSVKVATDTMSQYGMGVSDLSMISDVLVQACGDSKLGMEDLTYAMSYAGPAANAAGVSFKDTVAALETFSQSGIRGEKAGTALVDVMNTLVGPTGTQAKALGEIGVELKDVDPRTHKFADVLGTLKKKADASGDGLNAFIKIFGQRGGLIYGLAGATKEIDGFEKKLDSSKGAAERMAKFMLDTLSGSFDAAMGAATDLAIGIGQDLAPTIKGLLDWFSSTGAPAVRELYNAFKEGDWGKIGEMISNALSLAKDKAIAILMGLGDKIKALPWGDWFDTALSAITSAWEKLPTLVKPALDKLASWFGGGGGVDWPGAANRFISTLSSLISSAIKTGLEIGSWIYDKVTTWVTSGGPKKLGESIVDTIAGAIKGWLGSDTTIWGALKKVWGVASDWIGMGWEIIKGIGSGILGKVNDYLGPTRNQFLEFVRTIGNAFFGLGTLITTSIGGAIDEAGKSAASLVTWMGQNIPGVATMLGGSAGNGNSKESVNSNLPAWITPEVISKNHGNYYNPVTQQIIEPDERGTNLGMYTALSTGGSWTKPSAYDLYKQKQAGKVSTKQTGTWNENTQQFETDTGKPMAFANEGTEKAAPMPGIGESLGKSKTQLTEFATTAASDAAKVFSGTVDKNFVATWTPIKQVVADGKTGFNSFIDSLLWQSDADKAASKDKIATEKTATIWNGKTILDKTYTALEAWKLSGGRTANLWTGAVGDTAKVLASATQAAKDVLIGGSQTAATAIRLGGEVSANFTSMAGQAVKIGLDATGREIAIIGQVAQKQWTDGGNQLYSKVLASGDSIAASSATASANLKAGGESAMTGGIYAGTAMSKGADGITAATGGLSGALGAAAGAFGSVAGSLLGGKIGSVFSNASGGGTGKTAGNIGTAVQTFNDCFFEGFTDECTNMNINALKYTSPSGVVQYVNPMNNDAVRTLGSSGGGGSTSSGGSSGGGGGYSLPAIFRASGALVDGGPELSIVGESGPEMILPTKLTRMFLSLADAGLGQGASKSNPPVVIENIHHHYWDGKRVTGLVMTESKKRMQLKGVIAAR